MIWQHTQGWHRSFQHELTRSCTQNHSFLGGQSRAKEHSFISSANTEYAQRQSGTVTKQFRVQLTCLRKKGNLIGNTLSSTPGDNGGHRNRRWEIRGSFWAGAEEAGWIRRILRLTLKLEEFYQTQCGGRGRLGQGELLRVPDPSGLDGKFQGSRNYVKQSYLKTKTQPGLVTEAFHSTT